MRAVGIVIRGDKIALIHRIKNGEEYYVFPGGMVEEGETSEEAVVREVGEELGLECTIDKMLFELDNSENKEIYYLMKDCAGDLVLGGPEGERANKDNQYILEWRKLSKIMDMENLHPKEVAEKIIHNS